MTLEERVQQLETRLRELNDIIFSQGEKNAFLERKIRDRDDEEGYERQGPRYSGKHPQRCACNRCLSIR